MRKKNFSGSERKVEPNSTETFDATAKKWSICYFTMKITVPYPSLEESSTPVSSSCSSPKGARVSGLKPEMGSPMMPTLWDEQKKAH